MFKQAALIHILIVTTTNMDSNVEFITYSHKHLTDQISNVETKTYQLFLRLFYQNAALTACCSALQI